MEDIHGRADGHRPDAARTAQERRARILGWLSGLGLLVVPVLVAGVLATAGGMLAEIVNLREPEPQDWDAERTFPWLYLGTLAVGLGWIIYGSVRITGFLRGALPGAAISLAALGGILVVGLVAQP